MSGVIYKIVTGNEVYVGSTFNYKQRLADHKSNIINENSRDYNFKLYKTIRANDGEWEISIYEDNLSMTKDELHIREEEVRLLLGATLNSRRAHMSEELRKETERKRSAKWREENKDRHKEESKKLVTCECGCIVTKYGIYHHRKTAKHARLMISPELP